MEGRAKTARKVRSAVFGSLDFAARLETKAWVHPSLT